MNWIFLYVVVHGNLNRNTITHIYYNIIGDSSMKVNVWSVAHFPFNITSTLNMLHCYLGYVLTLRQRCRYQVILQAVKTKNLTILNKSYLCWVISSHIYQDVFRSSHSREKQNSSYCFMTMT